MGTRQRVSNGKRLKASSGNDYREKVTRKIAVQNPFEKAQNKFQNF
jgi:hypothetical protein